MQDKYAGDIGDFGKLGLLRHLAETGLTIGVNWYHAENEENSRDGGITEYGRYRECDPELYDKLQIIADADKDHRTIQALEKAEILNVKFYSKVLSFTDANKQERQMIREKWLQDALVKLSGCQIIFVDPDNGIMTKTAKGSKKSNKYVCVKELRDYYKAGATVIYYQHQARYKQEKYAGDIRSILSAEEFRNASGALLRFNKQSVRYYGFMIQPDHAERIRSAIDSFLQSDWKNMFTEIVI